MIVDSGVWIDHFSGRSNAAVRVLHTALRDGDEIFVLSVILQEVLQGTRDAGQFRRYARLLAPVPLARVPNPRRVAVGAAHYYAKLRWRGVTVPTTDCFIAAAATACRRPLLTMDADFHHLARMEPRLRLVVLATG